MSGTMQAVSFSEYGSAEVLRYGTLPIPTVQPNQVLVRVAAAGVNPSDRYIREGRFKAFARLRFPFVPGLDIAGVVTAVGTQVTRLRVGDHVYAMLPSLGGGGYAEYAAVSAELVALAPRQVALTDAAAVPTAALTALQGWRGIDLQADMRVLVYGASGGVGSFAVQIAKQMGAHVTAVTSWRNVDRVRALGADAVIDYTRQDVSAAGTFDALYEAVGLLPYARLRPLVRRGGAIYTVNPVLGNPVVALWARLHGQRLTSFFVKPGSADLDTLRGWIDAGTLRPLIDRCYALDEAADAQRYSETGRVQGKLVLLVDEALAAARPAAD